MVKFLSIVLSVLLPSVLMGADVPPVRQKVVFQFDVARGCVPKVETVMRVVDLLKPHGLDGVMLYLEDTLATSAFPSVGAGATPVTAAYVRELSASCAKAGVDLIPHLEILGHKEGLLALPEFSDYADSDDPRNHGHELRIDLPEVREKMKTQIREIAAMFPSKYVHCGGDEAFTLGLGRSRGYFEKKGYEKGIAEYVNEINACVRGFGKTMVLYADTPIVYPGLADLIDDDIILMNWAYCISDEVYEKENHHYAGHKTGIGRHRFWVGSNSMAEYVFTPYYRLEENLAIWRKLGAGAETLVVSNWGDNAPTALAVLGALYELNALRDSGYARDALLRDYSLMAVGRREPAFEEAIGLLFDVAGPDCWPTNALHYGPILKGFYSGNPESRLTCAIAGMLDDKMFDRAEAKARRAVALLDSLKEARELWMLSDLQGLSKRTLAAVLRGRLLCWHAKDAGGIWFREKDMEPRRRLHAEIVSLLKEDLAFAEKSWRRENLESCLDTWKKGQQKVIDSTGRALRLPKNALRGFLPRPWPWD